MSDSITVLDRLQREWPVIAGAPLSFVIAVFIAGAAIYFLMRWRYKALLAQKDEQLNTLRLAIDQYRERLHLQPPAQSRYTRMTNAELQQEALETVQQIRPLVEQYNRDESVHRASIYYPRDASEETKNRLFYQQFRETTQRSSHFMAKYNEQFLAEVILLRNEINKRLSHLEKETNAGYIEKLSEKPMSPRDVELIVLDLERSAKSLPVSG